MAIKVTAQVFGGSPRLFETIATVADVKRELAVPNHTATINGEPASDGDGLNDYDFVSLAPAVKGAL